jgi:hypothetical protein
MKLSTMTKLNSSRRTNSTKPGHQVLFFDPISKFFGGALMKGRRKTQRPLAFKRPLHIVLKSSKARGKLAFMNPRNKGEIEHWLVEFAKVNGIRVYQIAVSRDHIQLLIRFPNRASYKCFIRSITGTLPRSVLGFEHPNESFWDHQPFSRIIEWGKDYRGVMVYLNKIRLEANGLISKNCSSRDPYAQWLSQNGAFGDGESRSSA